MDDDHTIVYITDVNNPAQYHDLLEEQKDEKTKSNHPRKWECFISSQEFIARKAGGVI